MKKTALFFLLSIPLSLFAQDMDLYHINQDDKLKMQSIPEGMTYDEFHLLSTNLRMKDMLYAMIVPGYVHYQANEKRTAAWMFGLRISGFTGLGYISLTYKSILERSVLNLTEPELSLQQEKLNSVITTTSLVLVFGTYFYDWIHGQYKLSHNQDMIRYKFGLKMKIENLQSFQPQQVPSLSLSIRF